MSSGGGGVLIKTVRLALKLLLFFVFHWYMVIWCMKPTTTYFNHWLPDIQAKTSFSFIGDQGAYILIFTFPILFVATMACLYLYLGKKCQDDTPRWLYSRLAWLTQPLLVKGPLGIVSCVEVSFLAMFVALLVWSLWSYLHNMFPFAIQVAAHGGMEVWEAKLQSSGLSLGLLGNICLAFLFYPVARGSSVLQLVGLTSEASIKYHIWLGHMTMTIYTAHGLSYIIFWARTHQLSQMLKWDKTEVANLAGEVALVAGFLMWMTSFAQIRRKVFEIFYYTHHLYILFIVFYVFHVGFASSCIILPGFYLFLIDRYLRLLQSQQRVRLFAARVLPCETVELNLSRSPGLDYNPTSTMFINIPCISKMQWHPFTITSNNNVDPDKLSIVIKSGGRWSRKLYQMLSSPSPASRLELCIEGPYGPASTHFLRHDMLVLVSGGSGIAPFISMVREILFTVNTTNSRAPKVLLVCAFRKSVDLTMLDLLLPVSSTSLDISQLQIQIEAYVTGENEPKTDNHKPFRTVWFKPDASDAPVFAVLGPKSWIWLGIIISTSFFAYLILIGLITRYYIYPIDHNTGTRYSSAAKAAFSMLFICVAITITASAAFFWNKKQNFRELKHIENMDITTPTGSSSPASRVYNVETELESLPHRSLRQDTKVHFSGRPDLKGILFGCKEDSVGVFVSGPRGMTHEVAAICSSGHVDNLHFESISFTW